MNKSSSAEIIIQARMGSTRLPGKMLRTFYDGKTLLQVVIDRLTGAFGPDMITVATSNNENDDFIEKESKKCGVKVFRGSEKNVLDRFVRAAEHAGRERVIRICADNPFIQTNYVQRLIDYNSKEEADYVGYRLNKHIPGIKSHLGFFPELIKRSALEHLNKMKIDPLYREHVTNYFYSDLNCDFDINWIDLEYPSEIINSVRLTIDTEADFQVAEKVYRYIKESDIAGSDHQILDYLKSENNVQRLMEKNIRDNEK